MSLNILTSTGLKEINSVTKEKVLSALDYTPANVEDLPDIQEDNSGELYIEDEAGNVIVRVDENGLHTTEVEANGVLLGETLSAHTADSEIHVTAAEKEAWDNKSGFSGVYDDLLNKPNINDDSTGNLQISDENGNVVAQFDENGLTATEVTVSGVKLGETLTEHTGDSVTHITDAERKKWNDKSDFSGVYSDLVGEPNITEDESGIFQITDDKGNVAVQVDNDGLKAGTVHTGKILVSGEDIKSSLDAHKGDVVTHITSDERSKWNNKSDFSGLYTDLIGEPNIAEDDSGIFQITDDEGNIAVQVDNEGLKAGTMNANKVLISGEDIKSALDTHKGDEIVHITEAERQEWNAKATTNYVDTKVASEIASVINSAPETLDTLNELAEALGNDNNFATTVTNALAEKAKQTDLDMHKEDPVAHVTSTERTTWNNKSDFSGSFEDLDGKPNITDDGSDELNIADETGNVIARFASDGLFIPNVITNRIDLNAILDTYVVNVDYSLLAFDVEEIV